MKLNIDCLGMWAHLRAPAGKIIVQGNCGLMPRGRQMDQQPTVKKCDTYLVESHLALVELVANPKKSVMSDNLKVLVNQPNG